MKFNQVLDAMQYGRYRATFNEFEFYEGMAGIEWMKQVVLPGLKNLSLELVTFGYGENATINMDIAQRQYDKWSIENPDMASKVTFKQFVEIKQKQVRAAMAEARIAIMMMMLVAGLGWKDDDDKPLYSKTRLGRLAYKALNRANSEITFAMSPSEFMRLTVNPIPIARLLSDVAKTVGNTLDEGRDLIFDENSPSDKTPPGFYSTQWIIGFNQLRKVVELYEQDKKNPY
jgi:hypothetical protein